MSNPFNADAWLRPATPGDRTLKEMKERPAWWSTSIGGSGTIAVHWMSHSGEVPGSAQTINVSQEVGIMGLPGIVVPLDPVHPQTDLATNQGDPRATWIEIVALTGALTWGRYGTPTDVDATGRYLKSLASDSHLTYAFKVGTSLRIGPCPDPDLGSNGAMEVDEDAAGTTPIITTPALLTTLLEEALPSVAASAQIFANAPAATKEIWLTIRVASLTLRTDNGVATAGANGSEFALTSVSFPYLFRMGQTAALLVKAIQNGGTATGWIVYRG